MRRFCLLVSIAGLSMSCARTPAAPVDRRGPSDAAGPAAAASQAVCPPAASDFGTEFIDAAKLIRPALVSILPGNPARRDASESALEGTPFDIFLRSLPMQKQKQDRRGVGSGVLMDHNGNILTSNHIVEGASTVRIQLFDGRELTANLVGSDAKTDLAVVRVPAAGLELQPAQLGDSDKLQLGEWVMSCGIEAGSRQTVYAGIVNAVGRGSPGIAEYEDFIQTFAAIHPSTSGGPLVDRTGRVVGITTTGAAQSGGNGGAGFAIPINMARSVLEQLLTRGKVVRGNIGVYVGNISDELAHSFGYRGSGGALVQDVAPEGPGARADVRPGDIIIEQNGRPVANATDLRNAVASLAPGTTTKLRVFRDGRQRMLEVGVEELPGVATTTGAVTGEQPRWGMELAEITPELRERLVLGATQRGAVVLQVTANSPAEDAGLRAGDLITNIGENEVHDADQARRLLLTAKAPVRLRIVHDGRGSFVILQGPS
jgi:serine protease Do